jgi:hypothetical protein
VARWGGASAGPGQRGGGQWRGAARWWGAARGGTARWWGGAAAAGWLGLLRMAAAVAGRCGPPNGAVAAPPLRRESSCAGLRENMMRRRWWLESGKKMGYLYPEIFSPGLWGGTNRD